ncbi:MAG: IclR family transcriptional regulator [Treponema sp.]|nr:IclR family transcriptional regulator [Treponema sp.]
MEDLNMIQKTINILDYLSIYPNGATLSTITKDLGYPKTTVFDILKTLLMNDFVQYVKPGKKIYCVGARLFAIGSVYTESSILLRTVRPYLMLLADKYGKTTFFSKRHNDCAICVYKYVPQHAKAPTENLGLKKLLHSTATGKCYLAFDTEAFHFIDTINLPAITPYTITDREKLKAHIAELRLRGYSWEQRESYLLSACLAAPIFTRGAMVGAISMVGWYREGEDFTAQGNEILQLAKLVSSQLDQISGA